MLPPMNLPQADPNAAPPANPDVMAAEALARADQAVKGKRLGEAIGICHDLLEAIPDYPPALATLGALIGHRGDLDRGIGLLIRACQLAPGNANWWSNLSALARIACRMDEALEALNRALQLAPGNAGLILNLAKLRMDRGELPQATAAFLDVLAREPDNPEAHLALGQMQLMTGEYGTGWLEYEWRNQLEQARGSIPKMVRPQWNGMQLPGAAILLIGDQGFGDTLQFARLIPRVAERCEKVYFGCAPELAGLLPQIPGITACYQRWQDIPPHAVYCRLSSVPALLGLEIDSLPGPMPYLFADADLTASWAERLARRFPMRRPRVGLVWAGRTTHPNDRRRSLALAQIHALTRQPDLDFVSLQKVVPARDTAGFTAFAAQSNVLDVAGELADFSVTAAVVANLDLVITVDSSVAHLAGAMGRPVWVLTSNPADWRWMLERSDTPWYPSMRLFRQPTPGDWPSCIAAAATALTEFRQLSRSSARAA